MDTRISADLVPFDQCVVKQHLIAKLAHDILLSGHLSPKDAYDYAELYYLIGIEKGWIRVIKTGEIKNNA